MGCLVGGHRSTYPDTVFKDYFLLALQVCCHDYTRAVDKLDVLVQLDDLHGPDDQDGWSYTK